MITTVLDGHVSQEKWPELEAAFAQAATQLPPQILRTSLLQSADDRTLWRVATLWRSKADLEEYRTTVETPKGVLLFRAVGAKPVLSIFEVVSATTAGVEGTR